MCDPANCELKVYAYGIRNAGGGIAVNPQTGELWCSVNERDALGDNLVPDYITHVRGRWILWLAVVVHGGASGSAAAGEASGVEG